MTLAASHQDEVQTVTTTAPAIVGVQLLSTSADEGATVVGNFALHFPERQRVSVMTEQRKSQRRGVTKLLGRRYLQGRLRIARVSVRSQQGQCGIAFFYPSDVHLAILTRVARVVPSTRKVTLFASGTVMSGKYSLAYSRKWANESIGYLSSQTQATTCLDWNANAEEVRTPSPLYW